jgi:predicted ATPase
MTTKRTLNTCILEKIVIKDEESKRARPQGHAQVPLMIKSVKFKIDWRCFVAGELFDFNEGVNLLVGDQGSGKSSLLTMFSWAIQENKELDKVASIHANRVELRMFDFERDNPRTRGYLKFAADVAMRYQSHGNCVLAVLGVMGEECERKKAFILDEPDMALSVRSIYKLIDIFRNTKHQVIAAVHNPLLIQAFPQVLSLEHRKWMPSGEFIESQKAERESCKTKP